MNNHIQFQPAYEGYMGYAEKYVVKYKFISGELEGESGESLGVMEKATAEEVAHRMNKAWPEAEHWVERA